jgi:hypothetical protein
MSLRDYRYLKGESIDTYSYTQPLHSSGVSLEKDGVFFWDRIISDSENESFCYFCGKDIFPDLHRFNNSCKNRYCDELCHYKAYSGRGLWFYEDLEIFQVERALEKDKKPHNSFYNNRRSVWNDFFNYLNQLPSNEERQVLSSSVKLFSLLFHQLFFNEIVYAIAYNVSHSSSTIIKPNLFCVYFTYFLQDESHRYDYEQDDSFDTQPEQEKNTGLLPPSLHSTQNDEETLPHLVKEQHTPVYHEYIYETYSFLKTLLLTGDYVNIIINLMEKKALFSEICEQVEKDHFIYNHSQVLTLIEERFLILVNERFTTKVWYEINYILNAYSISIYQESSFLKEMKQVALVDNLQQRKSIILQYSQLIHDSERFFLENNDLLTLMEDENLLNEERTKKRIKNENHEILKQFRSLIFLSQAAELANKPNPFNKKNSGSSTNYPNPFDGYGFRALVLSPQYIPMQVFSSMKDMNAKKNLNIEVCNLTRTIRFDQSCYPNLNMDIIRKQSEPMKLNFTANRDKLTFNMIKEKKKEGFLHILRSRKNPVNNGNQLENTQEFAINECFLGTSSGCSHCYYPDTQNSLFPTILCYCMLCKYEENEFETLKSRLFWIDYPPRTIARDLLTLKRSSLVANLQCLIDVFQGKSTFLRSLLSFNEEMEFFCDSEQFVRWEEILFLGDHHMSREETSKGIYLYLLLFLDFIDYLQKDLQRQEQQNKTEGVRILKSMEKRNCWEQNKDWFPRLCQSFSIAILEYFLERYNHFGKSSSSEKLNWKVKDILYICEIGNFLFPETNEHISEMVHKLKAYRSCWDKPENKPVGESLTPSSVPPSSSFTTVVSSFPYDQILSESIFLTKHSFLSSVECQYIIKYAEDYAVAKGWTTNRHYSVPTTDISLSHLSPNFHSWFMEKIFSSRIEPLLYHQFYPSYVSSSPFSMDRKISMIVNDLFIVKYHVNSTEAGQIGDDLSTSSLKNQSYLPFHSDQSTHSFVISLNSSTEYEGGGTYFMNLFEVKNSSENVINPGKNQLLYVLSASSLFISSFSRNWGNGIIPRTSMSWWKSYNIWNTLYYCWFLNNYSTGGRHNEH